MGNIYVMWTPGRQRHRDDPKGCAVNSYLVFIKCRSESQPPACALRIKVLPQK